MNKTNFGLVGGDVRLLYAARRLKSLGYGACFYSPDGTLKTSQDFSDIELLSLCDCVKRAQVIILPLPASRGDGKINCPLLSKELDAGALFSCVRRSTPVFAGKADKCISVAAREAGVRLTDYFTSESLLTSNALYTAEGALSLIISELPRALCGSVVAILNFAILCLTVQSAVEIENKRKQKQRFQLSYNLRLLLQHIDQLFHPPGSEKPGIPVIRRSSVKHPKLSVQSFYRRQRLLR